MAAEGCDKMAFASFFMASMDIFLLDLQLIKYLFHLKAISQVQVNLLCSAYPARA